MRRYTLLTTTALALCAAAPALAATCTPVGAGFNAPRMACGHPSRANKRA